MNSMVAPVTFLCLFFTLIARTKNVVLTTKGPNPDPEKSIVGHTESALNYKTLAAVMRATEVDKLLNFDGPYTVFAPSDAAFEKMANAK